MLNFNEQVRGGTLCLNKAGLGIGSTPAELSIAAPNGAGIDYAIEGIVYHLADDATVAMSAHTVQAINTTCLYLVQLNAAGTLSTVKGTEVLTADLTAGTEVLVWPRPTASNCPIGFFTMVTNGSVTFTGGTTSLATSGLADLYYDLFAVPEGPRTTA